MYTLSNSYPSAELFLFFCSSAFGIWHLLFGTLVPWVPEGFFFRSEAAIVSSEAAIVILARDPGVILARFFFLSRQDHDHDF